MANITYNDKTQLLPYNDKKFNAEDANELKRVVNQKADLTQIIDGNQSLGAWNAATNTPALTTTPSTVGKFYTVSVAGTSSITGSAVAYQPNDKLISNGTAWQYVPFTNTNGTIVSWSARAYKSGSYVNYLGKDWVNISDALSTDVPSATSLIWSSRLLAYDAAPSTTPSANLFNIANAEVGSLSTTSGVPSSNASATRSQFMPIKPNTVYSVWDTPYPVPPATLLTTSLRVLYYTSTKAFISTTQDFTIPSPADAAYARITLVRMASTLPYLMYSEGAVAPRKWVHYGSLLDVNNTVSPVVIDRDTIAAAILDSQANILTAIDSSSVGGITPSMVNFITRGVNKFNIATVTAGSAIGANGVVVTNTGSANQSASDFIPVVAGQSYMFTTALTANPVTGQTVGAYYNENKVYISALLVPTAGVQIAPPNAAYLRFSAANGIIANMMLIQATASPLVYSPFQFQIDTTKVKSSSLPDDLLLDGKLNIRYANAAASGGGASPYLGSKTWYGAKGNAILLTNGNVTAGSTTITASDAAFTTADIGKVIAIPYAGADNGTFTIGGTHVSTITAINSPTSCTIAAAPVKSVNAQRTITDGAIALNTNILTSATANFTSSDLGKKITIPNAGELQSVNRPRTLTVYITGITNSTTVTITKKALIAATSQTINIPGAWIQYGTDDTTVLQNAINDSASKGYTLLLENGRYLTTSALVPPHQLSIYGQGRTTATIAPVGSSSFAAIGTGIGNPLIPLRDNKYENFEIDCFGVTVNTYAAGNKGLHITHMLRPIFRDLYIHDSSATGLGCDFLMDCTMVNNVVSHCGRQVFEFGQGGGGSGIGIGTGAYTSESALINGNFVTECGKQGIFVESQSSNVLSRGIKITNNTCNWNGNAGIGDRATDGTITSNNVCNYNGSNGIELDVGFVAGLYSVNAKLSNNYCVGNFGYGIRATFKSGNLTIIDNEIDGEGTRGNGGGLRVSCEAGGTPMVVTVSRNIISNFPRKGMDIFNTGAYNIVKINDNTIINTGTNPQAGNPALEILSSINKLYVKNNIFTDTRAIGAKTQSYGFIINSGITINKLVMDGNDFTDNKDGETNFTGATIGTTVSHFNP